MRALPRPASNAARHRPTRREQRLGARAGHQWYTAFGTAVGAAAIASAVLFIMPDPAAHHVARGCGPGTCTAGLAMPAHAALRPSANPSATTPAPAPPRAAPAQPARQHRSSPSPSPHHVQAWGLVACWVGVGAGADVRVRLPRQHLYRAGLVMAWWPDRGRTPRRWGCPSRSWRRIRWWWGSRPREPARAGCLAGLRPT